MEVSTIITTAQLDSATYPQWKFLDGILELNNSIDDNLLSNNTSKSVEGETYEIKIINNKIERKKRNANHLLYTLYSVQSVSDEYSQCL